jgi:hypothetical protein
MARKRKIAARKAVLTKWRKYGKRRCAACKKKIVTGGIKVNNRWYHRTCYRRKQVTKLRMKTATRGYYKKLKKRS